MKSTNPVAETWVEWWPSLILQSNKKQLGRFVEALEASLRDPDASDETPFLNLQT